MATEVVKIQVPSRSKSPAVRQRREVSTRPSSFMRSWIGPNGRETSSTSLDTVLMSPEIARVSSSDRARSSYTNAMSFAKPTFVLMCDANASEGNNGTGHIVSSGSAEQSPRMKRKTLLVPNVTPVSPSLPLGMPMSSKRRCLVAASILLTHGSQTEERFCFLCNDVFLIAKQKSGSGLRLKQQIALSEMWVSASVEGVTSMAVDASLSFVIGWPMTNLVASFTSTKHRQMWFSKLHRQIDIERLNLTTQSATVRVYAADKKLLPSFAELSVSASDDITSLVTRCCSKWSLETTDVRLWLMTNGRSVPLLGHESPLAIKLSMQKTHGGKGDGVKDSVSNLGDQQQQDDSSNCRFVLRSVRKTDVVEPSALHKLLRRPLLSIKLKRDNKKTSSHRGLFGRSLADVCSEDRLPESLMAMLEKIFTDGVYVVGVLRKPANKRRINEVRDKLDAGEDVTIESAILAAGLFKEYLRSLPECLLTRALYDNWLDSMTIEHTAARLVKIKELYASIPACNRQLVSYIFCILYHMNQNSDINKMTSHNLALCISSTLLWTESVSVEDSIRSASLVAFLIEHTTDIFGDDCIKLLGDLPPLDADEITADELSTPDVGNDKTSSVFSSADSLDSPVTEDATSTHSPRLTDSGCYTSSMDGDSMSPLSVSLADVTSRLNTLTPLRSRSLDDELDDASNGLRLDSLIEMVAISPLDQDDETGGMLVSVDDFVLALQEETVLSNDVTHDATSEDIAASAFETIKLSQPAVVMNYEPVDVDNGSEPDVDADVASAFECLSRDAVNRRPLAYRRHHSQTTAPHIAAAADCQVNRVRRSSVGDLTPADGGDSGIDGIKCLNSMSASKSPHFVSQVEREHRARQSLSPVTGSVDNASSWPVEDIVAAQWSAKQQQSMVPLSVGPAVVSDTSDDFYHVHGVLSVKGPVADLHLASVKKVNSTLVHSSPDVSATTEGARRRRKGIAGSVHADHNHSNGHHHHHHHQSRQLPVPPPYQEAVWRAEQLKQGINPERKQVERGHNVNDYTGSNQHRAFKDYTPAAAYREPVPIVGQKPVTVEAGHHQAAASQQFVRNDEYYGRPVAISPPRTNPVDHHAAKLSKKHQQHKQQRHSHHESARANDYLKADVGRLSRTPQPERPPAHHHQRRAAATPTYPEGYWVTRLDHTTTDDDSLSTGGHSTDLLVSSYGSRSNVVFYNDAGYAPEYSRDIPHVSSVYAQYDDQREKSFHYPYLALPHRL